VRPLRKKIIILTLVFLFTLGFSAYITTNVLNEWMKYSMDHYSYQDNGNIVYKTFFHYQQWGPTMSMYHIPAMRNISLEQPSPPSLRRNSDDELIIIFWLHRNGLFGIQDQVLDAYRRIISTANKGYAAFETPVSLIRVDCQNDSEMFFVSLTEYMK